MVGEYGDGNSGIYAQRARDSVRRATDSPWSRKNVRRVETDYAKMERNLAAFVSDHGSGVEHPTPDAIFDAADREFGPFTLDPATALGYHSSNVILDRGGDVITLEGTFMGPSAFHASEKTGLEQNWHGRVWLNHPYGRDDWRWIKKARDSVREGDAELVCALIPVKSSMKWWRLYVCGEIEVFDLAPGFDGYVLAKCRAEGAGRGADVVRFLGAGVMGMEANRVTFGDSTTGPEPYSAPFASALVVWRR